MAIVDRNKKKLTISPIHSVDHACKDFRCKTNEFCISRDLLCDNVNHCGDGSDESSHAHCQSLSISTQFIRLTESILNSRPL